MLEGSAARRGVRTVTGMERAVGEALGEGAHWRVHAYGPDQVLRIPRQRSGGERGLQAALVLTTLGVPVALPAADALVTLPCGTVGQAWERLEPAPSGPETAESAGRIVRLLHDLPQRSVPSDLWGEGAPTGSRERILEVVHASGLAGNDLRLVRRGAEQALAELEAAGELSRESVLGHGDVHLGNFLQGRSGLVLADLDGVRSSVPYWDETGMFVDDDATRSTPEAKEAFLRGARWEQPATRTVRAALRIRILNHAAEQAAAGEDPGGALERLRG